MKLVKNMVNPYSVNGKELSNIIFFNPEGEVFKTNRGWFGDRNDIGTLEMNGEVINKRKIDYKSKKPFLIRDKSDSYEKVYILYYPYREEEWTKTYSWTIKGFMIETHYEYKSNLYPIVQDVIEDKHEVSNLKIINDCMRKIEFKTLHLRQGMYKRNKDEIEEGVKELRNLLDLIDFNNRGIA